MAGITFGDGLKVAARVLTSTRRPLLAHLVVTRYCNLECAYCFEYDKVSKPVPLPDLLDRVDALARLGTQIVTLTGGEPLSHPDHDAVVRRIRDHGMMATSPSAQRFPAHRRPHRRHERRRSAGAPDLHRWRQTRRHFQEDPEIPGREAASSGQARGVSRQHQLGPRHFRGTHAGRSRGGGERAVSGFFLPLPWSELHDAEGTLAPKLSTTQQPRSTSDYEARPDGDALCQLPDVPKESHGRQAKRVELVGRGPVLTCTCARMVWCITARSSADRPASRSPSTARRTSFASSIRPRPARRSAP